MLKDNILRLLLGRSAPLSGQAMSRELGISRAGVWKAIEGLRQEGYTISSAPNRGYRLEDAPDRLRAGELSGFSDNSHFIRTFGHLTGLTPGRYAKEYQASDQVILRENLKRQP